MFIVVGGLQHERLEPSVQHKRCNCVHELSFKHLYGGHLRQIQPPRVDLSKVNLLKVLIEQAIGKQVALPKVILG